MSGASREAEIHIITGAVTSAKNIAARSSAPASCVRLLVPEPLAPATAVLDQDERDRRGAALTSVAARPTSRCSTRPDPLHGRSSRSAAPTRRATSPPGRTPMDKAEAIKIQHGSAWRSRRRERGKRCCRSPASAAATIARSRAPCSPPMIENRNGRDSCSPTRKSGRTTCAPDRRRRRCLPAARLLLPGDRGVG